MFDDIPLKLQIHGRFFSAFEVGSKKFSTTHELCTPLLKDFLLKDSFLLKDFSISKANSAVEMIYLHPC